MVTMSWASRIPEEMLHQPKALVALSGLDATFNAVHKSMLDAFSNLNRSDRVPLRFKLFSGDHEYPKAKNKRTSYEWYVPKGILKSNWMRKHLEEIPAVVAIFFDLDWDEPQWRERQMECATRVEIVRKSLQGRGTKVAVVLIQKRTPLPPGEDMQATERAQAICAACELSAKNLFVLPQSDHLMGYIIRLENAFSELAYSYYQSEAKKIKSHKEFLNKTTHQLLFVRHQFKIAYFNEMKQDVVVALKHYRLAYNHILDLRMHEAHLLEIKTIAGFINYKICKLAFQQNSPLDAIPQFRKHIEHFRHRVGILGLQFEHAAWMSKQFEIFGDLFHEAIRQGLAALQTQHPGFYYHQAAKYAISRKSLSRSLCTSAGSTELREEYLTSLKNVEFYGQRPWRQGNQNIDPPDATKEKEGIAALQILEHEMQHATLIIPLLNNAVAQFKRYRSPRMKQYLLVTMGEEHYDAGEYRQSLICLSRVLSDYRREKWWSILTAVLSVALKCAYLTANPGEYANVCIELLEENSLLPLEEKHRLQANLMAILSGQAPQPEPSCNLESVESARTLWGEAMQVGEGEQCPIAIEMSQLDACIDCKVAFDRQFYHADTRLRLMVHLRSTCPETITFHRISVFFTNPKYDESAIVTDDLSIGFQRVRTICLALVPEREDVGHRVRVHAVELQVIREGRPTALLRWSFSKPEQQPVASMAAQSPPLPTWRSDPDQRVSAANWTAFYSRPYAEVRERPSQVRIEVEHEPPILVNEFYRLPLCLISDERFPLNDMSLSVAVMDEDAESGGTGDIPSSTLSMQNSQQPAQQSPVQISQATLGDSSTHVSIDQAECGEKLVSRRMGITLGELLPGDSIRRIVFIKCLRPGTRRVHLSVSYSINVAVRNNTDTEKEETADNEAIRVICTVVKTLELSIPVVEPFSVDVSLRNLRFQRLSHVKAGQAFIVVMNIRNVSPWSLKIEGSTMAPMTSGSVARPVDANHDSQVQGIVARPLDNLTEAYALLVPDELAPIPLVGPAAPSLGTYIIQWRRYCPDQTEEEAPVTVSTDVSLPVVDVHTVPLHVHAELPAFGVVRQAMPVTYLLENRSPYPKEVEVQMDPVDGFMFSGNRHAQFRVLPHAVYYLCYNLYPLDTGEVALPRLHVKVHRYETFNGQSAANEAAPGGTPANPVDDLTVELPRSVFVKPCGSLKAPAPAPTENDDSATTETAPAPEAVSPSVSSGPSTATASAAATASAMS